jgi:hypothetical protein
VDDTAAVNAQSALTAAYNDAMGRTLPTTVSGDIGGLTLTPGLYMSTSSLGITGVLTLNGQGDANSVFIFQIGSSLTTATGSQVKLIGGAQAANIFWQVGSSATLGTYSIFNGTILAQVSVSLLTGAALNGTGSLPPGLGLDASTGAVTGTPTGFGNTDSFFSANALDAAAGTANRGCVILTAAPGGPPTTPAPSSVLLVAVGLACAALYKGRERLLRHLRKI